MEREAELVATDEHGAAAELAQEAQHGEVVVGLDGVPHDGAEPLQCLAVGGEVAEDLRLAVEVEGAPRFRRADGLGFRAGRRERESMFAAAMVWEAWRSVR